MNKVINALNSIYYGFLPMSQVKVTLFCLVFFYSLLLCFHISTDLSLDRRVMIEHTQEGGVVVLDGVKYIVPYTIEKTKVSFTVSDPFEFLFLCNNEGTDSLVTVLLKLTTCVYSLWLIWKFNVNDPFDPACYKYVNTLFGLLLAVIFVDYFENIYLRKWTGPGYKNLGGFKVSTDFEFLYYLAYLWILRAVASFYKSGVKTRRETELTV